MFELTDFLFLSGNLFLELSDLQLTFLLKLINPSLDFSLEVSLRGGWVLWLRRRVWLWVFGLFLCSGCRLWLGLIVLLSWLCLLLLLNFFCWLLCCRSSTKLAAIHRTLDRGSLTVKRDLLLADRLAILESANQFNCLVIVLYCDLLSLVHLSIRPAIDERRLLAPELWLTLLLILAQLRLVVLESSLIEVSIAEVKAALAEVVLEHEAIEEGAILPVLLGLASLLAVRFLPIEALVWLFHRILVTNSLDLSWYLLGIVGHWLALRAFKLLYSSILRRRFTLLGHRGDLLIGDPGENLSQRVPRDWISLHHLLKLSSSSEIALRLKCLSKI